MKEYHMDIEADELKGKMKELELGPVFGIFQKLVDEEEGKEPFKGSFNGLRINFYRGNGTQTCPFKYYAIPRMDSIKKVYDNSLFANAPGMMYEMVPSLEGLSKLLVRDKDARSFLRKNLLHFMNLSPVHEELLIRVPEIDFEFIKGMSAVSGFKFHYSIDLKPEWDKTGEVGKRVYPGTIYKGHMHGTERFVNDFRKIVFSFFGIEG
jgi:hypothetical protein